MAGFLDNINRSASYSLNLAPAPGTPLNCLERGYLDGTGHDEDLECVPGSWFPVPLKGINRSEME